MVKRKVTYRPSPIGIVQGVTITANDEAPSTHRATNVSVCLRRLGLKDPFAFRGNCIPKETGAAARRINLPMTYPK